MADQNDRRRVAAVVGDRVLGDLRTHHGLVDRRLEAGMFDSVGQIVRPAREDLAGKAAKQIGAQFRWCVRTSITRGGRIKRAPQEPAR